MYVEESGAFPVAINSRMSAWIICRTGMAPGGRRRSQPVEPWLDFVVHLAFLFFCIDSPIVRTVTSSCQLAL